MYNMYNVHTYKYDICMVLTIYLLYLDSAKQTFYEVPTIRVSTQIINIFILFIRINILE